MIPKFSGKTWVLLVSIAVVLVAIVPGYFFYLQYEKTQKQLENPTDAAAKEVEQLQKTVGELILLPSDEEPTIETVSDKAKLGNQAFFERAKNGDKVLIYTKSRKAYLYRPSLNKLVDIGPVNVGGEAPPLQPLVVAVSGTQTKSSPTPSAKVTPTASPTPTSAFQKVTVALYNGTRTAGLAARTETSLKTSASFATVVAKGNSATTVTETLVIDFTGKYKKEAAELVKVLGGTTGVLPRGEIKPTADILVILGPQ